MHESVDINYLSVTGMCCWLIVIGCNHIFREFSILPKYTSAILLQQQLGWALAKICTQSHCSQWWSAASRDALGLVHSTGPWHMEELTVRTPFFTLAALHAHQCCFLTLVSIHIVLQNMTVEMVHLTYLLDLFRFLTSVKFHLNEKEIKLIKLLTFRFFLSCCHYYLSLVMYLWYTLRERNTLLKCEVSWFCFKPKLL